jgi:hypothetical protein
MRFFGFDTALEFIDLVFKDFDSFLQGIIGIAHGDTPLHSADRETAWNGYASRFPGHCIPGTVETKRINDIGVRIRKERFPQSALRLQLWQFPL